MKESKILGRLMELRDPSYGEFQKKLIPTVNPETVIGVRTPELRKLAKEIAKQGEGEAFLQCLPHVYFDENQLHAFLIAEEKDFARCIARVEAFLPYVDNWATCDQLSPGVMKKHREELLPYIRKWLESDHTYTVRFALGMLMQHYLDDAFEPSFLELAAGVRSEDYYIRMMAAWYFATALAKQYGAALPYIERQALEPWTHNRAIQKALESYRITPEQKEYLKTLKVRDAGKSGKKADQG